MKRRLLAWIVMLALFSGCEKKSKPAYPAPAGFGAALVEVSGGKQVAAAGSILDQPVVVQVNDAQGNAVPSALVIMHTAGESTSTPAYGLTDSSGQLTTTVTLGGVAGRYQFVASTFDRTGKRIELKLEAIALGYQQVVGRQLNQQYCARCHDPESTPERVSNFDNLATKPHAFTEGDALNKLSDADLVSIISHGGAALNKSPEMPPYGFTLSKNDIEAVVAYIRAVSDPPYQLRGVVYAKNK